MPQRNEDFTIEGVSAPGSYTPKTGLYLKNEWKTWGNNYWSLKDNKNDDSEEGKAEARLGRRYN